jgi:hypothetical protein
MDNLPIYKIDINEFDESGIEFISLVANPAIMLKGLAFASVNLPPCHDFCKCEIIDSNWVFGLSDNGPCEYCVSNKNEFDRQRKSFDLQFNEEKQIIAGPAIIPDFKIYRYDKDLGEYYVVFTKEVIEKMVEKFNQLSKQTPINLDHSETIAPAFIKGSWIIENSEFDKSRVYGFDLPEGTWFLEVKVTDPSFWNDEIKKNGKFGFSVEGLMGLSLSEMIKPLTPKMEFVSYDDYPQAASDNAARALRIRDENPKLKCGTQVGWVRANQLANRQNISEETIARMSSFQRHYENSKGDPTEDCGALMWLAWGGTEGIEWASRKLERIRTEVEDMERVEQDKVVNVELNTQINNNNKQKMKKRFKFAEYMLQDGTTKISIDGELAVGSACYVVLEDGTLEQAPEGEHILEDGTTIFVDAEGLINEVRSAETTAVAEGEVAAAVTPEEATNIISEVMLILDPKFEELRMIMAELATRIETLESHEVEPVAVDEMMEKFSVVERLNSLKVKLEALTPLNKNK